MFDVLSPFPSPPRPVYLNRQMNRLVPNSPIPQSRKTGFTLVEILVVVAIIGILAGIVLKISGYAAGKSDRAKALSDLERIKTALEEYRINKGQYWGNTNVITIITTNFPLDVAAYVNTNGLRIVDPWGRNYKYQRISALDYKLWSGGPNDSVTEDDVDSSSGTF